MKKRFFVSLAVIFCVIIGSIPIRSVNAMDIEVNHTVHNDIITIVDESTQLFRPISSVTDEDYHPYSRKWNGMPSVITAGNNIFVAWQTGGVKEPDPDNLNYIVIAVSTDGGVSWIDPFIIIDPLQENRQAQVPMFYYNNARELYMLFSYTGLGIHAIKINNADGDLKDITCEQPIYINTRNSSFTKPVIMSDKSIMYASGTNTTRIFKSTDDGKSFNKISEVISEAPPSSLLFSESTLLEKKDGTIWHLRRLEKAINGGIEQSFSADGGLTWSMPQGNLPSPLQSPGSRFNMQRLSSGAILFVTNAAGMGMDRTKMTAYLSLDDGESWPYSLLLDAELSSYPDFCQDSNGNIYVVFDKDRYGEGGIRLCKFTEQDVIDGKFASPDSKQLITIAKMNNEFGDIKIVNGFPKDPTYKLGLDIKEIIKDYPKEITVYDDNGKKHTLSGIYRVSGYKKDKPGVYKAYFITDLPYTLKDSYDKLQFDITLEDKKGCSSVLGVHSIFTLIITGIGCLLLLKF